MKTPKCWRKSPEVSFSEGPKKSCLARGLAKSKCSRKATPSRTSFQEPSRKKRRSVKQEPQQEPNLDQPSNLSQGLGGVPQTPSQTPSQTPKWPHFYNPYVRPQPQKSCCSPPTRPPIRSKRGSCCSSPTTPKSFGLQSQTPKSCCSTPSQKHTPGSSPRHFHPYRPLWTKYLSQTQLMEAELPNASAWKTCPGGPLEDDFTCKPLKPVKLYPKDSKSCQTTPRTSCRKAPSTSRTSCFSCVEPQSQDSQTSPQFWVYDPTTSRIIPMESSLELPHKASPCQYPSPLRPPNSSIGRTQQPQYYRSRYTEALERVKARMEPKPSQCKSPYKVRNSYSSPTETQKDLDEIPQISITDHVHLANISTPNLQKCEAIHALPRPSKSTATPIGVCTPTPQLFATIPIISPQQSKTIPISSPSQFATISLLDPQQSKTIPISSLPQSTTISLPNPQQSKTIPISSPISNLPQSATISLPNPQQSRTIPISSPPQSTTFSIPSPSQSRIVPVSSPTQSTTIPIPSPKHSKIIPISSPQKSTVVLIPSPQWCPTSLPCKPKSTSRSHSRSKSPPAGSCFPLVHCKSPSRTITQNSTPMQKDSNSNPHISKSTTTTTTPTPSKYASSTPTPNLAQCATISTPSPRQSRTISVSKSTTISSPSPCQSTTIPISKSTTIPPPSPQQSGAIPISKFTTIPTPTPPQVHASSLTTPSPSQSTSSIHTPTLPQFATTTSRPRQSRVIPIASPSQSSTIPIPNLGQTRTIPISSPPKSSSNPKPNPKQSRIVPISSPQKSTIVPIPNPQWTPKNLSCKVKSTLRSESPSPSSCFLLAHSKSPLRTPIQNSTPTKTESHLNPSPHISINNPVICSIVRTISPPDSSRTSPRQSYSPPTTKTHCFPLIKVQKETNPSLQISMIGEKHYRKIPIANPSQSFAKSSQSRPHSTQSPKRIKHSCFPFARSSKHPHPSPPTIVSYSKKSCSIPKFRNLREISIASSTSSESVKTTPKHSQELSRSRPCFCSTRTPISTSISPPPPLISITNGDKSWQYKIHTPPPSPKILPRLLPNSNHIPKISHRILTYNDKLPTRSTSPCPSPCCSPVDQMSSVTSHSGIATIGLENCKESPKSSSSWFSNAHPNTKNKRGRLRRFWDGLWGGSTCQESKGGLLDLASPKGLANPPFVKDERWFQCVDFRSFAIFGFNIGVVLFLTFIVDLLNDGKQKPLAPKALEVPITALDYGPAICDVQNQPKCCHICPQEFPSPPKPPLCNLYIYEQENLSKS